MEETHPYALMQGVLLRDQRAIYCIKTELLVTTGSVRSPEHNCIRE